METKAARCHGVDGPKSSKVYRQGAKGLFV